VFRLGVLPEGDLSPTVQRPVRDVLRKRTHLVEQQSANVVSMQNIMLRNPRVRLRTHPIKCLRSADLERLLLDGDPALALSRGLAVIHCLAEQIKLVGKRVQAQIRSPPLYRLLQTVTGIGPMLAQTIL
jgi:hypothetical protein